MVESDRVSELDRVRVSGCWFSDENEEGER